VDDAGLVRQGHLTGDGQRLVQRHGAPRQPGREVVALDQLHDDGAPFEAVHVRDVGVVERGERLCFALEAREPVVLRACAGRLRTSRGVGTGRQGIRQDLQRDVAVEFRVAGTVDLAHSTRTEGRADLIRSEARSAVRAIRRT
jgi:hypothetical protein